MFILTVHWDFREIWGVLTITAKFYAFFLLASAAYTVRCLARTSIHLHDLSKNLTIDRRAREGRRIEMTSALRTVRQLQTFCFLLFCVVLANEVFAAFRAVPLAEMSLSGARIEMFEPLAIFRVRRYHGAHASSRGSMGRIDLPARVWGA